MARCSDVISLTLLIYKVTVNKDSETYAVCVQLCVSLSSQVLESVSLCVQVVIPQNSTSFLVKRTNLVQFSLT